MKITDKSLLIHRLLFFLMIAQEWVFLSFFQIIIQKTEIVFLLSKKKNKKKEKENLYHSRQTESKCKKKKEKVSIFWNLSSILHWFVLFVVGNTCLIFNSNKNCLHFWSKTKNYNNRLKNKNMKYFVTSLKSSHRLAYNVLFVLCLAIPEHVFEKNGWNRRLRTIWKETTSKTDIFYSTRKAEQYTF